MSATDITQIKVHNFEPNVWFPWKEKYLVEAEVDFDNNRAIVRQLIIKSLDSSKRVEVTSRLIRALRVADEVERRFFAQIGNFEYVHDR